MDLNCFACGERIQAESLGALGERFLGHARDAHEWPYPDQGIRNFAEATQRLTGASQRVSELGQLDIHPVDAGRLDDWAAFFDHDAFVGTPEWAACYCTEPHVAIEGAAPAPDVPHWRDNRQAMLERLRVGTTAGYLAYVDERPAGWVNASLRSEYTQHLGDAADPPGTQVVGVACFVVAPPFRRHGIAGHLLDRVIEDAPGRGAAWVEAYPFTEEPQPATNSFRGHRSMYDQRAFEPVRTRARDTVMRRPV